MLSELDVLVFDIQDIGARFYTYIWTMALAMEAAAEQGIAFVVLDRPNPITGLTVQGNVLDAQFSSFVGLHPIPVVHGMTVGEMARLLNQEGWLKRKVKADLVVIPMTGWERGMWYEQTGLIWRKPSPNMPDIDTAAIYPGMALLEGTNVSEGRGTDSPFKQFGAPWIDARTLTDVLNRLRIPGVGFTPVEFTPASSKHTGLRCFGCRLVVKNRDQISAYRLGLDIVKEIRGLYPEQLEWRTAHFDRLCGTDKLRQAIVHDEPLDILLKQWQKQMKVFELTRAKYLLY